MEPVTLGNIVKTVQGTCSTQSANVLDTLIYGIGDLSNGSAKEIGFLANHSYEDQIYNTALSAVLVKSNFEPKRQYKTTLVYVEDVMLSLITLLQQQEKKQRKIGVESPIHLGQDSHLGQDAYLGAFAYIGDHVHLGNRTQIHPHAYIGDGVRIGDDTIIYPGAVIHSGTQIGKRCAIHSGAILGQAGFGYTKDRAGKYQGIPHIGQLIIEDDVRIGANTTIDKGTFGSTHIEEGVKLDNLVQIGHNFRIGKHTVIAALFGGAGSSSIGKYCVIGGHSACTGHLKVADHTTLGGFSLITKDTKTHEKLVGFPATNTRSYSARVSAWKKIEQLEKRIAELEKPKRYNNE